MAEMRTIQFSGKRGARKLHIEAPGCIVNITKQLTNSDGQAVTSVQISADQYEGDRWTLPDLCDLRDVAKIIAENYVLFDTMSREQIEEYLRANLPTVTNFNVRAVQQKAEVEETLPSTINTPAMHRRIVAAAAKILNRPKSNIATHFEHGQWWVEDLTTGAQWSVVDATGGASVDGFDFEQVTEGDESC